MPKYIHAHICSQAIKALIVSLLITFLSAVFSLPALSYLPLSPWPFILDQASERTDKEKQGRGRERAATRGHGKVEGTRRSGERATLSAMIRAHTGAIVWWGFFFFAAGAP